MSKRKSSDAWKGEDALQEIHWVVFNGALDVIKSNILERVKGADHADDESFGSDLCGVLHKVEDLIAKLEGDATRAVRARRAQSLKDSRDYWQPKYPDGALEGDKWQNWGLSVPALSATFARPMTADDVKHLVADAKKKGKSVRCIAHGHSWTPVFYDEGSVVLFVSDLRVYGTDERIVLVRPAKTGMNRNQPARVRVAAGVSGRELADWLEDDANRGDVCGVGLSSDSLIAEVKYGGLVSMGCHGTGSKTRTISDMLVGMTVVDGDGELKTYSFDADEGETRKEVMAASFGLTGVIIDLTLELDDRLETPYLQVEHRFGTKVRDLFGTKGDASALKKVVTENEAVELFWMPLGSVDAEDLARLSSEAFITDWEPLDDPMWLYVFTKRVKAPPFGEEVIRYGYEQDGAARGIRERTQSILGNLINELSNKLYDKKSTLALRTQALSGMMAHKLLSLESTAPGGYLRQGTLSMLKAIHYKSYIDDVKVYDFEVCIPVDMDTFVNVHEAWRAVVDITTCHIRKLKYNPLNTTMESRFTLGSSVLMSPAYYPSEPRPGWKDRDTQLFVWIEVLCAASTPLEVWLPFVKDVHDAWVKIEHPGGAKPKPHWAKWNDLSHAAADMGNDWITPYVKDVYKDQIEKFTASLQPQDKSRFSNAFVKKTFSLYSPGAASEGPSHHCVGMAGGQLLETRLGPCGSGRQDAQKRVFIGYAGEDFNFVELLKNKLEPYLGSVWVDWENVVPFEDNLASQPAYVDRIKGELQDAALIIFVVSKKWVGKNFPMLELEWALNLPGCGTRVLPVLLDWNLTEAKESNLAIAGSANLLHRLFNLTTLNTDNDHSWSDLIDLVANTVVERPGILPKTSPANWVGREADVKAITAALGISESGEPRGRDQEGCIVALGGMSGVGKSALLKHLYDLARPNYVDAGRKVVFVAVGHDANDTKIMAVQKQILAGLGVSFKEGESLELKLQIALRRDSYTLFVDDVWHGGDKRQLESLFGGEWKERLSSAGLGKGSIVVIAGQALPETLQSYYKHKLGRLSNDSAMKLFCRNAFGRDEAPNGCTLPWKDVVDACAGLPLALTVFGSVLQGKDDSRWNEALADLRHVSDPEVGDRLKVAYKLLESEQRHAFVDIAMHWHGQAWEVVNAALGHGLLTELLRRSLVDKVRGVEIVGWDRVDVNVVGMHDLLKNVGKAKANERNSWLVDPTPERVKKSKPRGVKLTKDAEKFQKGLLELRILIIEEGFSGKINLRGCEELRWLAWLRCPDTSMELNRCEKLVWLDLRNGALRSIGLPKTPTNLRYLDIKGCRSLPELSALTNLEWLSLESSTILSLPDNLRYLDIKGCRSLPELSALSNLEWLSLESSTILSLPDLSALTKLKLLDLSSCTSLTSLPDLLALTRLETLNLRGCTSLPKLSALSALTILERLDLRGCTSLTSLPELLALTSLETLDLSDGTSLTGLPQLSALTKLETLDLQHCTNLTSLPDLSSLTKLERLYLEECTSLTSLPELFALTKLRELLLRDCTSLTSLPELSALTNLAMLDLRGCTSLTSLPELLALTSLETLDLRGCTSLTSLPGLSALTNLESLDLRGCTSLTSLPDLPALNLKSMNMMGCTSLTSLPGLSVLTNLTDLDLSGCTSLTSLPDLSTLSNLEWLDLSGCTSLTSLPELLALTSLETLDLSGGTSPRVSRVIKQKPAGGRKPTEVNEVISDSDDDEKPAKKGSTLKRSAESTSTDAEPAKKKKSTSEE